MHTACKIDPVYRRSTRKTYGYVAPNFGILAQIAPPVPGDAMSRLFGPRTFTQLQGKKEGAFSLSTGEQPPYAAEGFFCDSDEHLSPPRDPWPMAQQPRNEDVERMKSQILDSLLRGASEAILSPSISELALPESYDPGESSVAAVLQSLYIDDLPARHLIESIVMIETPTSDGKGGKSKNIKLSVWKVWDRLNTFGEM